MIIKNGKLALPCEDEWKKLDIRIQGEEITELGDDLGGEDEIIDAEGLLILPGGIDPHVHFDEPGYTEREDFYYGSSASASGGITTVIDMPCTSIPPITSRENLLKKLNIIKKKAIVDFGLFGGISSQSFEDDFARDIEELLESVLGFKTYFISGMPDFGRLDHYQFREVLKVAKRLNIPVLLHAEDYDYVKRATEVEMERGDSWINYYRTRPEVAEVLAVQSAVQLAEEIEADLHIVHIGSAKAGEILWGRDRITGETAPHYLEFDYNDLERIGSALKVTPPVKSPENKQGLWNLLADGVIDFIASDHAPAPEEEKNTGSVWSDYSGIPGTGTLLPYIFARGYLAGRIPLRRLLEVISESAAKRYGIYHRKGSIEVGKDADLVLIDPERDWIVRGDEFFSKGKVTPFEGMKFRGKIVKTILRGRVIYDDKKGIVVEPGYGKFLKKD